MSRKLTSPEARERLDKLEAERRKSSVARLLDLNPEETRKLEDLIGQMDVYKQLTEIGEVARKTTTELFPKVPVRHSGSTFDINTKPWSDPTSRPLDDVRIQLNKMRTASYASFLECGT